MKIEVTKEDIENGTGRDCQNCAVARAINRVLPDGLLSYVNPYGGMFTREEDIGIFIYSHWEGGPFSGQRIDCPREVVEFAEDFDDWYDFQSCNEEERIEWNRDRGYEDDYEPVEPWEFSFELPINDNPTP